MPKDGLLVRDGDHRRWAVLALGAAPAAAGATGKTLAASPAVVDRVDVPGSGDDGSVAG